MRYLVLGSGRVARHICFYLAELGLSFIPWSRVAHDQESLPSYARDCSHALILLSDSAIETFVLQNRCLAHLTRVHFSGALSTEQAFSAHPLFTFSKGLYTPDTYRQIPFILEKGGPTFTDLLPGFPNRHEVIEADSRAYYHSLCVLSGNFTNILWQKLFHELESRFQIPREIAIPYLEQTLQNLKENPSASLTGPLVRRDFKTIKSNIKALQGDPFQTVYYAFLEAVMGGTDASSQDGFRLPKNEKSGAEDLYRHLL
ncbi:MAG: DUF2520 domain-containing protein [Oligoflexales bacterium]|nr:DUF2520 domain-containing protein [Oligoflexales bacterium]